MPTVSLLFIVFNAVSTQSAASDGASVRTVLGNFYHGIFLGKFYSCRVKSVTEIGESKAPNEGHMGMEVEGALEEKSDVIPANSVEKENRRSVRFGESSGEQAQPNQEVADLFSSDLRDARNVLQIMKTSSQLVSHDPVRQVRRKEYTIYHDNLAKGLGKAEEEEEKESGEYVRKSKSKTQKTQASDKGID